MGITFFVATQRGKRRIVWLDMTLPDVTLTGARVRLEPLEEKHADALLPAAAPDEIWPHLAWGSLASPEKMRGWIADRRADRAKGLSFPFVIIEQQSGRPLGSSSYIDIALRDRRIEIGSTWLTPAVWRTAINTECKYLLMKHAFEHIGVLRLQLKTDIRNLRSQAAIQRLGAVKEGILRSHMVRFDGSQRDTVMFSIIANEWPAVKSRLEAFLGGGGT